MKRTGRSKMWQNGLALAGVVLLITSFASLSEGWLFQWCPQLFTNVSSISQGQPGQASKHGGLIPPLSTLVVADRSFNGIRIAARLEIPRLHVSTLVVEGDGEKALRLGVGHVPGSALAETYGNTVLAGHRDTFFRCLRHIQTGDEVVLDIAGDLHRYRVTRTRIVSPSDVAVMKSSGAAQLTLITCYPFGFIGSAPKRLVVDARPLPDMASVAD